MNVRSLAALLSAAVLLVMAAAGPAMAAESVSIVDFKFVPSSLTISAGTTVVWTNNGEQPHTATADDGSFDSSPGCPGNLDACMQPGDSYSHTFNAAGTISYHCSVHPFMTGTIEVQAAGTSPGPGQTSSEAGGPLPNTGSSSLTVPFVGLGILFLVSGGFVLYRLRRRA